MIGSTAGYGAAEKEGIVLTVAERLCYTAIDLGRRCVTLRTER